jgi:hypothetical protein
MFSSFASWPSSQMPMRDPAPFGPMATVPPFMMDVAESSGFWGKRPPRIDEATGTASGRKKMRGQMDLDIGHSRVHAKYPENGRVPLYVAAAGGVVYSDVDVAAGDVVFRVDLEGKQADALGTHRDMRVETDMFEWSMSHPLLSLYHVNKILLDEPSFRPVANATHPLTGQPVVDGSAVLARIALAGAKITPNDKTVAFLTHDDGMDNMSHPSTTVALRGYCTINSPWLYSDQQGQNLLLRLVLVEVDPDKEKFIDVENNEATLSTLAQKASRMGVAIRDAAPVLEKTRWQLVPYTENFLPGVPATPFCGAAPTYGQLNGLVGATGVAVTWSGGVIDVGYTVDRPRAQMGDARREVYLATLVHPMLDSNGEAERQVMAQARISQPLISIAIKR